jgi:hypothetical protein
MIGQEIIADFQEPSASLSCLGPIRIMGRLKVRGWGVPGSVVGGGGRWPRLGAVENPAQKSKAEQIANSVSGVKKVNNLLEVKSSAKVRARGSRGLLELGFGGAS